MSEDQVVARGQSAKIVNGAFADLAPVLALWSLIVWFAQFSLFLVCKSIIVESLLGPKVHLP